MLILRIKHIANKVAYIKKEIDRSNRKLALLTGPFPTIRYDEQQLFIVKRKELSCFSRACRSDKKRCVII